MEKRLLENIEPKEVFYFFEEISKIPRGTGNEKAVSDWLVKFAKDRGLYYLQDEKFNIYIRKEATKGYESRPGVIFQSHMDMVCEKKEGARHDFLKDPINIVVEGDKITARDTTLGGDDGIGMALTLALLDSDTIEHPLLEAVITVDEELGMTGAECFDAGMLEGDIFINLDSDDDGVFVVGSAGGPTVSAHIPIEWENGGEGVSYMLSVTGLLGGHSGEDIHRERGNANKLISRVLDAMERTAEFEMAYVNGGVMCNAIPREARALLLVKESNVLKLKEVADEYSKIYANEYRLSDKGLTLSFEPFESKVERVFSKKTKESVISFGCLCETGIIRMNLEFENVVESSNSLGTITTGEESVKFTFVTRSSIESMYRNMVYKIDRLAKIFGGYMCKEYDCLEWPYDPENRIKKIFESIYIEFFGREARSVVLHTGLECGIIGRNVGRKIDMISMGPECKDLHMPGEWLSIESTKRYWSMLAEVLRRV